MFLSFAEMQSFLGLSNSSYLLESVWNPFVLYGDSKWMIAAELQQTLDRFEFTGLDISPLWDAMDWLAKQPKHTYALAFLRYAIMIGAHPSRWLVKHGPRWGLSHIPDSVMELLLVLSLVLPSIQDHRRRNLDDYFATFNLGHLRNYIHGYVNKHHVLGIEPFGWTTYLATLGLLPIGSFQFMHHVFTDPYFVYRKKIGGNIVVLAKSGLVVNSWGQFSGVNQNNNIAFRTSLEEVGDDLFAYKVLPNGIISAHPICLNKQEWELILEPGMPVIDFHIPSKTAYDLDSIKSTFQQAIAFFHSYYPEHAYQAFWCVSWLYSPQLPWLIRKPDSNILHIHKQGYICPATPDEKSMFSFVLHKESVDWDNFTPKTSLEYDLKAFYDKGGRVNAGLFLYFFENINQFGTNPYRTSADDTEYSSIKPYAEESNV